MRWKLCVFLSSGSQQPRQPHVHLCWRKPPPEPHRKHQTLQPKSKKVLLLHFLRSPPHIPSVALTIHFQICLLMLSKRNVHLIMIIFTGKVSCLLKMEMRAAQFEFMLSCGDILDNDIKFVSLFGYIIKMTSVWMHLTAVTLRMCQDLNKNTVSMVI